MSNNKQRYINTKFWNDGYVSMLDPIEKLLFIYFLTNEHTNISGFYEIPKKLIGVETGIDVSMLDKILPRIEEKIRYFDGYIIIKNFVKHQETGSLNVKTGILNCLKEININLLKDVINKGFYELPKFYLDTLCIGYTEGSNYLDSHSYLHLDSNLDSDEVKPDQINLPDWLDKEKWSDWLEYRKQTKKKMSPITITRQLKLLEDNKTDHKEILERSITNGWTGLFPLNGNSNRNSLPPSGAPYVPGKYKDIK